MHVVEDIVGFFGSKGSLIDPEAAAHLARKPNPMGHVADLTQRAHEIPLYVTLEALEALESIPGTSVAHTAGSSPGLATTSIADWHAKDVAADVTVLHDAGRTVTASGQLDDFVRLFNDRYDALRTLLRKRRETASPVALAKATSLNHELSVIGLVQDVSTNRSGHVFMDLEDPSGTATLLIPESATGLIDEAKTLLPDEVVGAVVRPSADGGLLVVQKIVRPEIPFHEKVANPESPVAAAVLSDIHIGSRTFLEKPFKRMIRWLHGNDGPRRERRLARRIKYLVLAGDLVDGVGVFPGQEQLLTETDVLRQYALLAAALEDLPDWVHLIIQPGNHDAVRPNEPQPAFGPDVTRLLDAHAATFLSNPAAFRLSGVNFLSYHGFSFVDFATRVPGLAMQRPLEIMQQMLKCRHVAPAYGAATPLSPEATDHLVIRSTPDVFLTGHAHVSGVSKYRGVTLANGGSWQSQTDYQKTHNLAPTPPRLPVVDLGNLGGTQVDFNPS